MTIAIIIADQDTTDEYRVELREKPIEIGRSSKSDVTIKDKKASGHHCLLYLTDGVATIKDLETTNGTYINGSNVSETMIKLGDKITIGNSIEIKLDTSEMTPKEKSNHVKSVFARSKVTR